MVRRLNLRKNKLFDFYIFVIYKGMLDSKIKWVTPVIIAVVCLMIYYNTGVENYSLDNPILKKIRDNFALLDEDYGNIPLKEGKSSYTENKSVITLCLKDPETGKYYSMNTIIYVALHELAHMVTKTLDIEEHGPEFIRNFEILKKRAAKKGIYNPTMKIPSTYCGIDKQ
jgi:hypothetical protein